MKDKKLEKQEKLETFDQLKNSLLNIDPVHFVETHLSLDGNPFRLTGNGYKPYVDIYRYIGIKALEPNAKPMIIKKSRQTSGTTMANALEMYFMGSGLFGVNGKPPIRVMHIFPFGELAAAYSKTKLQQMINTSVVPEGAKIDKSGKAKSYMQMMLDDTTDQGNSLHFKQFKNGNHLWIESCGIDGDRIMGRSCDVIFFDEVQRTTDQAIGNSLKILTAAKYGKPAQGVVCFFGTPRKHGSSFHKMWQSSSQQYYYLGCENCKEYFPLYTPGSDEWKTIWLHTFIVKCTKCGHEQDKRPAAERGKWIALKDDKDPDCKMIGFHINSLYMPMFSKEAILAEMPGVHPINTERVFQNEVLGEFFAGDTSPISTDEIRELCGDPGRKYRAIIHPNPDQQEIVVMGLDYGLRNDLEQLANPDKVKGVGQSYSTAVILMAKGPNLLSIEYALKFKKNDPESKKGIIDQLMRQYNVQLAVGDIGYSNDFSVTLHNMFGDKYLVSRAHNKINAPGHIKYNSDSFPKEMIFERDYYIAELYEQMKKGQIRFPFGDYEKVGWLIEHCCSMEIKPSVSRNGGDPTIHYVKGSTPNDGMMALLNGYLAYKFLVTNGFKNNNPYAQGSTTNMNKPLVLGGFVDKRL